MRAVGKRGIPDIGDTGRNRDAGQVGAAGKRSASKADDPVGNGVTSADAARKLDERGLLLVE